MRARYIAFRQTENITYCSGRQKTIYSVQADKNRKHYIAFSQTKNRKHYIAFSQTKTENII